MNQLETTLQGLLQKANSAGLQGIEYIWDEGHKKEVQATVDKLIAEAKKAKGHEFEALTKLLKEL